MATQWTPAQLQAMQLHGRDILVSAAAGSGKTATLTERIIRDLKGENGLPPADISRMLIVTFTRAAARELRSRISLALSEAIAEDPENRHLYRQLLALGSARICTIDAFYQQPVRAHFERLGLPPSFRLADDAELAPLKQETMTRLLDHFYTAYVPDTASADVPLSVVHGNAFAIAMDDLLPNRERGKTIPVLLDLHKSLLDFPEGINCLAHHADRLEAQATLPLHQSAEGQVLIATAIETLKCVRKRILMALDTFARDDAARQLYTPQTQYDLDTVNAALRSFEQNDTDHAVSVLRSYTPSDYGRRTKKLQPDERSLAVKELRKLWKQDIADVTALFVEDAEQRREQMLRTARTERMLYTLLQAYDAEIRERKLARNIQEFSDVRHALLQLLIDKNGNPTDVARELCDSLDAVYIDEYQDVDTVQDAIFAAVGAGGKRFMVGDIKQSIYGFRGAEPSIFADYRRTFSPSAANDSNTGACLFMSENFRCDRTVIDFTNAVCGYIFGVCEKTLGYRPDDDLVFRKKTPVGTMPSPVQVVLLDQSTAKDAVGQDTPEHTVNPEAAYIAAEIDRLCREEKRADGTPIRPRDIAILLRKMTMADDLVRALRAYGIETTYAAKDPLSTHPDMITLLNVLSVIDNPRDDTPLMGLLSTGGSPFTLEELLCIRHRYSRDIPLYDAICLAAEDTDGEPDAPVDHPTEQTRQKCRELVAFVHRWQAVAHALPIDRLLRKLFSEPMFADKATTPVYLALYESARTYQNNAFCGLYQFLRYFRKLLQTSGAPVSISGVAEDAVSILTIHKSKGLEFPVVFVGHCAGTFSTDDLSAPVVFDHTLGIATHMFCEQDASRQDHIVRRAITARLRERLVEEEMRLLYVAATRARERLYLTAKPRSVTAAITAANRPMRDDRAAILSTSSFLPWILGALSPENRRDERADPHAPDAFWNLTVASCADYCTLPAAPTPSLTVTDDAPQSMLPATAQPYGSPAFYRAVLREHENYSDPRALLRTLPTKAAASKLRYDLLDHGFLPEEIQGEEQVPPPAYPPESRIDEGTRIRRRIELLQSKQPPFRELLKQKEQAGAAERGTATHLFLQYCSYERLAHLRTSMPAAQALEQELAHLTEQGFLPRRAASILNRKHLSAFLTSDLFDMVLRAKQIRRELHFNRFLPYTDLTARKEYAEQLQDASLYVQGSLDLLLQNEDGSLILCDYKTDRLRDDDLIGEIHAPKVKAAVRSRLATDHADQLRIYADAVRSLFGKAPDKVLIYSLPLGCTVDLTDIVIKKE